MVNDIEDAIHEMMYPNVIPNDDNLPVWVIGDVHGHAAELERLVHKVLEKTPECIIVQLGDLIDRGTGLRSVFKVIDKYKIHTVIGNHELNFIQEHFGYKQCRSQVRKVTHDKMASYNKKDQEFVINQMLKMKNYASVMCNDKVWHFTHAPMEKEVIESIDGSAASVYCMGTSSYKHELIDSSYFVHGHASWDYEPIEKQIADQDQTWYNVDSGLCYGNYLLALNIKTLDFIKQHQEV